MASEHSRLVNEIILEFSRGPIRLWRNETGLAIRMGGDGLVKYGLKGSADILGILGPTGRLVAIEVKTGGDRIKPAQKVWRCVIEERGGLYIEARSLDDVRRALLEVAAS